MVHYARCDTHYLLYIYDCLRGELVEKAVASELDDPFEHLKAVHSNSNAICLRTYEKPILKDHVYQLLLIEYRRKLSKEQFRVFKLLYKWRDYVARLYDESVDFILPMRDLVAIAEDMPTSCKELYEGQRFTNVAVQLKETLDDLVLEELCRLIQSKLIKAVGVIQPQDDADNLQMKGSFDEDDETMKGVDFVINQAHESLRD